MKFFIKTYGCVQNVADSDQIGQSLTRLGYQQVTKLAKADLVIINSCVVRQSAENRVYGLIENLSRDKKKKIIITGCLAGWTDLANKQKKKALLMKYPNLYIKPTSDFNIWKDQTTVIDNQVIVPISFGCNNYCSYCLVPFCRGKEVSRPEKEILADANKTFSNGVKEILLVGQNVNSYGGDFDKNQKIKTKNMGKMRNRSFFPKLLEKVAKIGFNKVSFISSNPWDFSDELIEVIAKYKNISRLIHLPIQSGSDEILTKMNRGYSVEEYTKLVDKIRQKIKGVIISTDIIVGFPGESDEIFEKSFEVYRKMDFHIAYLNKYSARPGTVSARLYKDDVSLAKKKERWLRLDKEINSQRR